MIRTASFPIQRQGARRSGFTLIEILVVLAIAAIISSVTLGGFKEMTAGNKRVSCSTNLTQLYQAARLYAADEGGKFPHYNNQCGNPPTDADKVGIGLWSLYTFPKAKDAPTDPDEIALVGSPVERYLRSPKPLHCPSDIQNDQLYLNPVTKEEYNPAYLSYQACDDGDETPALPGAPGTPTYATQRGVSSTADPKWRRQLLHYKGPGLTNIVNRQPTDDTVVTYCLHHRSERDLDNVLFYDGSVQLIPRQQNIDDASVCTKNGQATPCTFVGWERVPEAPQ